MCIDFSCISMSIMRKCFQCLWLLCLLAFAPSGLCVFVGSLFFFSSVRILGSVRIIDCFSKCILVCCENVDNCRCRMSGTPFLYSGVCHHLQSRFRTSRHVLSLLCLSAILPGGLDLVLGTSTQVYDYRQAYFRALESSSSFFQVVSSGDF